MNQHVGSTAFHRGRKCQRVPALSHHITLCTSKLDVSESVPPSAALFTAVLSVKSMTLLHHLAATVTCCESAQINNIVDTRISGYMYSILHTDKNGFFLNTIKRKINVMVNYLTARYY